jgi:polyketide biosynthesis 3-hydroxy-3-methylglutaryl-CoA synthase-like enzyme PksG
MIGRAVGIQAVSLYCGAAYVDVEELFAARGLDMGRLANLMMVRKSVPLPCEDAVSFAANAAWPMVAGLSEDERARIGTLIVATESAVDFSKSASTYVHDLLGLPRSCRLFEVKQACYAGVAALQTAAALTAVSPRPGALALVVSTDLPALRSEVAGANAAQVRSGERDSYADASSGAGAVAVLVGEPRLAELRPDAGGLCSYETADFCRPRHDLDLVDVDHSLLSYIDCLIGSFNDYAEHNPGADFRDSFAGLAMHTPFPGMVKGAHRTALRKLKAVPPAEVAADFERRLAPSIRLPQQVGNLYSGSTLLALVSALAHGGYPPGAPIGVYSYGGGCAAEFFQVTVGPQAPDPALLGGLTTGDTARGRLGVTEYEALVGRSGEAGFGVRDARVDLDGFRRLLPAGPRRLLLSGISDFHREYAWAETS